MGERTSPLRQRLREAAVEAMLDSAEQTMIAKGYDRATMQEIAAAAGCATGTFYLYFKNKEVLLQAIVERHLREMFTGARAALDSASDPIDRLQAAFAAMHTYVHEHQPFFRLFFSAMPLRHRALQQQLTEAGRQEHDSYVLAEQEVLRQAQLAGRLRTDFPPQILQDFMGAIGLSLVEQFLFSSNHPPLQQQMQMLWSLVIGGIGARSNHD